MLVRKTLDLWKKTHAISAQPQYTFEVSKTEEIFDFLVKEKFITFPENYKAPTKKELKGREFCKYHNFHNHSTNNCWTFRNVVQDMINKGVLKFLEKKEIILVDEDPFPPMATVNTPTFNLHSLINHKWRIREEIQIEVLKEIKVEVLKEIPLKFGDTMSEAADPLEKVEKEKI